MADLSELRAQEDQRRAQPSPVALLGVAFLAYEGHSPKIIEGLGTSSLCMETLQMTTQPHTAKTKKGNLGLMIWPCRTGS